MRRSRATRRNTKVGNWTKWAGRKNNLEYFRQALQTMTTEFGVGNQGWMTIGLVGSRDLPGVALRQAQSVLRWDRRPSYWSHAFLLAEPWDGTSNVAQLPILEVPIHARTGEFPKPERNGLCEEGTLGLYKDRELDANVALLTVCQVRDTDTPPEAEASRFKPLAEADVQKVAERARHPNSDRLRYDLWESLCAWQRYLWSDGEARNPLRTGVPVCASAYVEMAFEAIGLDLVPGASERNSAPEHIWNAALWWHQREAYAQPEPGTYVMMGCCALRDPGCSLRSPE